MELFKEKFESFWKRLLLQVSLNCVSIFTIADEFSRRLSSGFFGKRDVFLEKHLKVFKNTKHGYFLLECFSKVFSADAISKRSKFEFFGKIMFSCVKKNLIFQKSLTLANLLQIASPIVFLRKSSQNVQNLFCFCQKR